MNDTKKYFVLFQITFNCNQNCIFCNAPKINKQLDIERVKEIINDLKEKDLIDEVVFTGGEPTVHNHLTEAIRYSKSLGFKTRVITNGLKLSDKEYTKSLVEAGLDTFHISIQSHKKEIQDQLTKTRDSYEKTIEGIKNALFHNKEVCTITTINKFNMDHLCSFVDFMSKNFPKIKYTLFNFLDPTGQALKSKDIIPKLVDAELELNKLADLARQGKRIQIGSTPLCYLDRCVKASSEGYDITNNLGFYVYDLEKESFYGGPTKEKVELIHKKSEVCSICYVKDICPGIEKDYYNLYGTGELYPLFKDESPN